jgi:hypothetical protein
MEAVVYPREKRHLWWYCNSRDPAFAANLAAHMLCVKQASWDIRLTLDPTLAVSRNRFSRTLSRRSKPNSCRAMERYNRE